MQREFCRESIIFSVNTARTLYIPMPQNTKPNQTLTQSTIYKNGLKWIISLNIKPKIIIKGLEENVGESTYDIEFGKDFLAITPKALCV